MIGVNLFIFIFVIFPSLMVGNLLNQPSSTKAKWSLNQKKIVVTGGTLGIGKAIVEECASLGAKIITCARNEKTLSDSVKEWKDLGYDVEGCVADVSLEEGRNALFTKVSELFGGELDALINNVGTNIRKKAVEYTEEEYQKILRTNLDSAFLLTTKFYPFLKASKSSYRSVVNIGSVAGGCGVAIRSGIVYAMTKAAMGQMTYNLACEWAKDNIRINTIAPWYINTPLVQPVLTNPVALSQILDRTPMDRVGDPSEVSALAAFLCMDLSQYMTGQVIAVDGGFIRNGYFPKNL